MHTKLPIKNDIDVNLKEFALYTIYNRAIPSAIDGMKPTARKILYAMLQYPSPLKTKVKLSELGGGLAKFNYHHGEVSAQSTAVGMAQTWSNNAPLLEGYGNFGSRKIQEAAACRYIFASLSKNFDKYFKDHDVCPVSPDPENPEPMFYLPTIPWVLVNGVSGIATGFATKILPRSPLDLTNAVKKVLKNPNTKIENIKPSFPDFVGDVIHVTENTWKVRGIIEEVGAFYYKISEVPYGDDRAGIVEFLNSLIDDNKINDYDDNCSDKGFEFVVKVSRAQKEAIEKDPIKFFKLEKQVTENLTMIGHDGKIKCFDDIDSVIKYFVQYRLTKVEESMKLELTNFNNQLRILNDKIRFIESVLNQKINFHKLNKTELVDWIVANITAAEYGKSFINIPIYQLTNDSIKTLQNEIEDIKKSIEFIESDTPTARYLRML